MQIYNIPINGDRMETTRHGNAEFPVAIYETVLIKTSSALSTGIGIMKSILSCYIWFRYNLL